MSNVIARTSPRRGTNTKAHKCYNSLVDTYQQKQLKITQQIEDSFKSGENPSTIVEPVTDYVNDNRICLTSVVFIPKNLQEKIITEVIEPLRKVDPKQYFYLPSSLHITVNNIRTIEYPPLFNGEDIEKAKEVIKQVTPKYKPLTFDVKRLFELPASLAISAFSDKTLGRLALELRRELEKAGVPDNKAYASEDIVIANTTISRFINTPNPEFWQKVKEFKNIDVGNFEVNKISLITTNAVCHPSKTKIIEEYFLD